MNLRERLNITTPQSYGDLGLEVETEYRHSHTEDILRNIPLGWRAATDNSLRNNGIEYVTNGAVRFNQKSDMLKSLLDMVKKLTYINDSPRTSFHVHVNVLDSNPIQVYNGLLVYWLLEEVLYNMCGKYRRGNLFCLTVKEAKGVVPQVVKDITRSGWFGSYNLDTYKYGGVNLAAIRRYGTIEFRGMNGELDYDKMNTWVDILYSIVKNSANNFINPKEILDVVYSNMLKDKVTTGFMQRVFTDKALADKVRHLAGGDEALRKAVVDSARHLLQIGYGVLDWDNVYKHTPRKDRLTITPIQQAVQDLEAFARRRTPQPANVAVFAEREDEV